MLFIFLQDYADTEVLLSRDNVDRNALLAYAREAADFSTNHQLPTLDFAMNHYGQPDVAMFDFTCMYATENAALVRQRRGHRLLVALVGDSLLEVKGTNTPYLCSVMVISASLELSTIGYYIFTLGLYCMGSCKLYLCVMGYNNIKNPNFCGL